MDTIRRKVASRAFWSLDHPLNRAYCEAHSYEVAGVRYSANGFSLRELIEWTEALPATEFARIFSAKPPPDRSRLAAPRRPALEEVENVAAA